MNTFFSNNSNNMNNIASNLRLSNIAARRRNLTERVIAFFKDFGHKAETTLRDAQSILNKLNRNLTLAGSLVLTYVVALSTVMLLLGVIFWGVYTFVPAFFWDNFGKLAERTGLDEAIVLLNGVPMLYQALAALLVVCLCVRVGRPYCEAVLAIQSHLIHKDYAGIKNLLLGVNAHTNGLIYNVSGLILKCAIGTAILCVGFKIVCQ